MNSTFFQRINKAFKYSYYRHLLIDRALRSSRWRNRRSAPRSRRQIAAPARRPKAMTSQALARLLCPSRRVLHHRRRPTLSSPPFLSCAAPCPRYVPESVNTRWHDHAPTPWSHSRVLAPAAATLVTVCSHRKQRPNRHV